MVDCLCAIFGFFAGLLQSLARLLFGNPSVSYLTGFIIAFVACTNVQCARMICEYGWGRRRRNDEDLNGGVVGVDDSFGYDYNNGPHTWNCSVLGQSPIDIMDEHIVRFPIRELLIWNHYTEVPSRMTLFNDGRTAVLRAQYDGNRPTVCGSDLTTSYSFVELRFRWAQANNDGSEHMVKTRKYPLEIQAMHRSGPYSQEDVSSLDILVISFFCEVCKISTMNIFMDSLIQKLHTIKKAGTCVDIEPFPLNYLLHPFRASFYSYGGSLTEPPCYRGAEWFIYPEALSISQQQMSEFRQLLNPRGNKILRNSRPVQIMDDTRCVNMNFYNPNLTSPSSGDTYFQQMENNYDDDQHYNYQ